MHYQGPQGQCDISLYSDGQGCFGQTIEAQLGFPEAIHEMLLRTECNVVRIFRDAPPAWAECGFSSLRCEGAFLLDARRENYRTAFVRVFSEKGGRIEIDTDLGEGVLHGPVAYENGHYIAHLQAGETIIFWRGEQPKLQFAPLECTGSEEHFWGVKRVRRF